MPAIPIRRWWRARPHRRVETAHSTRYRVAFFPVHPDEAILQIEFAKELSDHPSTLLGEELVLRYAERQALGAQTGVSDSVNGESDDGAGPGFSIVPREKKLRIAGIVETEPAAGFGGFGSGRVLIPLEVAAALRPHR